jgi:hypothetical protein
MGFFKNVCRVLGLSMEAGVQEAGVQEFRSQEAYRLVIAG